MLVECVPNFSEGRDPVKVERLAGRIASVTGVHVLDSHMDPDHNRSVITFVGSPGGVEQAAVRAAGEAMLLIDLNRHQGQHPRIGATDVIPFVPLEEVTLSDCTAIAHRAGMQIWDCYQIPVYFYEAAALRQERRNLANIRRGGFEGLRTVIATDPSRRPDVGEPRLHPTAGATAVGARGLLIAFNVNLSTDDLQIARAIARIVRASAGGLPAVKALGILLPSRRIGGRPGQAQVSMNLTDWKQTSVRQAFDAVQEQAGHYSVAVESSEIVGLVPAKALDGATAAELGLVGFGPEKILENRLADVLGKS
ncbi:MAG: glutamate formimidoyltransferase [Acidobacteria bacterium]|nr:glutamate formimidoyltransferase [Acidobacteriota bacterium]